MIYWGYELGKKRGVPRRVHEDEELTDEVEKLVQ